jgi:hypothetical protein
MTNFYLHVPKQMEGGELKFQAAVFRPNNFLSGRRGKLLSRAFKGLNQQSAGFILCEIIYHPTRWSICTQYVPDQHHQNKHQNNVRPMKAGEKKPQRLHQKTTAYEQGNYQVASG